MVSTTSWRSGSGSSVLDTCDYGKSSMIQMMRKWLLLARILGNSSSSIRLLARTIQRTFLRLIPNEPSKKDKNVSSINVLSARALGMLGQSVLT